MTDAFLLPPATRNALALLDAAGADAAVVLGSGLGAFADALEPVARLALGDIPGAPTPRVMGHAGMLTLARAGSRRVLLFAGRVHGYEGRSIEEVIFPVRVCATLGIPVLIATNASGGIGVHLHAGDLMLVTDYMTFPMAERMGAPLTRIPSQSAHRLPGVDPALMQHLREAARTERVALREGVYGFCSGPTYETRAEIAFMRRAGIDAVGMSTVPEIVAAQHAGIRVAAVSCITNKARTVPTKVSHDEVTDVAARTSARFTRLLRAALSTL
jgi:purine-nucleoside phosphorylase